MNELTKISRKKMVIIILFIMVAIVFAAGGAIKATKALNDPGSQTDSVGTNWQIQGMSNQVTTLKSRQSDLQEKIASASANDKITLEQQVDTLKNQIDMYQYCVDQKIDLSSSDYRAKAVQQLFSYNLAIKQLSAIPAQALTDVQKKTLSEDEAIRNRLTKILDNRDFKGYIALSDETIQNNKRVSEGEKKIAIESNALRLKLNLTGETANSLLTSSAAENVIQQIEKEKHSLLYNIDYTGQFGTNVMLTDSMRAKIINDTAVNTYKLEHRLITDTETQDSFSSPLNTEFTLGSVLIVILIMILAGGSVSNELSTGSIKTLIIAPVNRWKIVTGKLLSLLAVLVVSGLLLYLACILANGVFFGFGSGTPYIYAANGTAYVMNFYFLGLLKTLTSLIPMLIYMVFAFMLSVITRNTAASVGISIAVYFAGSTINNILLLMVKGEWMKYVPFNNLNFEFKLFPYENLSTTTASSSVSTSLAFSLCYVAVLILCMGYTTYDSFCRRDIK